MNKNQIISILSVIIILAVIIGIAKYESKPPVAEAALLQFASCLRDQKVTMYGAAWCSHCQAQKKLFGDAFKIVPYVECPDNIKVCLDLGVEGYPTWILPSGKKLVGEQSLENLSLETACPLAPAQTQ